MRKAYTVSENTDFPQGTEGLHFVWVSRTCWNVTRGLNPTNGHRKYPVPGTPTVFAQGLS